MTDDEKKLVFALAQKVTGAHPDGTFQNSIFITNVERRMQFRNIKTVAEYLRYANSNLDEQSQLISSLSIHTTSWFRENPHYVILQKILTESKIKRGQFRVWCAACSTGEEVYSFALLLEEYRQFHQGFEYEIVGTDIDPLSLEHAKRAVYLKKNLSGPASHYTKHILYGSGGTEDYFTFTPELRRRCQFQSHDIRQPMKGRQPFDLIVCRNVLIYFSQPVVENVVKQMLTSLKPNGHLILGHSEMIAYAKHGLDLIEHSVYKNVGVQAAQAKSQTPAFSKEAHSAVHKEIANKIESSAAPVEIAAKPSATVAPATPEAKTRINTPANNLSPRKKIDSDKPKVILVVDDSRLAREMISEQLTKYNYVVRLAEDINQAERALTQEKVDLIALDLSMPTMRGDDWLRVLRRRGVRTPVVIVSEAHPEEAKSVVQLLEEGSLAYIEKRELREQPEALPQVVMHILDTRKNSLTTDTNHLKIRPHAKFTADAILIGASTGGPQAITHILSGLPSWSPPIVVVQHIHAKFAKPFAERIAEVSNLTLGQIKENEPLRNGYIYCPLGDYHLKVKQNDKGEILLNLDNSAAISSHRPSVDALFMSATQIQDKKFAAILLTGMGRDGAQGMSMLHQNGIYTVAQDQSDCVVFGMPKEAIERNAVDFAGNVTEIRAVIQDIIINSKPS